MDCIAWFVVMMEGVCFGSARFKLLISARTVLLTVTPLVVVGLLLSPVVVGFCTLIFLSSGAGAFPDDCIDVVVDDILPDACIVVVAAAVVVVLALLLEDLSEVEEDGVDIKSMVVPPAHVLLVLSS